MFFLSVCFFFFCYSGDREISKRVFFKVTGRLQYTVIIEMEQVWFKKYWTDNNKTMKVLYICHVMSLYVTAYPFPWGCGVLLLEPIPALSQGESPAHRRALTDEQCGVQYLAQGHFDMQLSLARSQALN